MSASGAITRAPRNPIGPNAGLRDLLDVYADTCLPFKAFLAHRWWHAHLSDLERCVRPRGTILDLGCGHGIFTNLMALRAPERQILALEKDPRKAAFARGRVVNVAVAERDILSADFPGVDVVTITDVLHHLRSFKEQEEILDAVRRILPPGGQLVVKEISKSRPIRYRFTYLLDTLAFPGEKFFFRHHEDFGTLLEAKGFTVEFKPLWKGTPTSSYVHVCTKRS
jgi:2-polyprenyl-6-hydroxyphenyl methylase/3-demethylubiquinone-9 3-methyltransferase